MVASALETFAAEIGQHRAGWCSGTAGRTGVPASPSAVMAVRLKVDMIACDGRGLCAEVLPELIGR